eukprot:365650-Chlamydomonas_euryale.AAC.13
MAAVRGGQPTTQVSIVSILIGVSGTIYKKRHQRPTTTWRLISPSDRLHAETSHNYDQAASQYSDHTTLARTQSTWLMPSFAPSFMVG